MPPDLLKRKATRAAYRLAHKAEIAAYYQAHKAEAAAYYRAHKAERLAYGRAHKAQRAAYDLARRSSPEGKAKCAAYSVVYGKAHKVEKAAYCRAHKTESNARRAVRDQARKIDILNAYGGPKCVCCGETLLEGLTIDHVNGDGAKHRKQNGIEGGRMFYIWLKKNNYPPGFQVLCATCNFAKGTGDHCPHKDSPIA